MLLIFEKEKPTHPLLKEHNLDSFGFVCEVSVESHSNTKLRDPDYPSSDPEYDSKNLEFLHERSKVHIYPYVKFCAVLFGNSRPIHESVTRKNKKKGKQVISGSDMSRVNNIHLPSRVIYFSYTETRVVLFLLFTIND